MTNADRIRAMSDEELEGLLQRLAYERDTPWSEPFVEVNCRGCPTTECRIEGLPGVQRLHECDFVDGICPRGSDILWWLKQEE